MQELIPRWHFSYLCTYDWYGPVRNAFDAGSIYYLASARGLVSGNLDFLGPKWHLSISSMPFHRAQNRSRFPEPNPLPLALVLDAARIKGNAPLHKNSDSYGSIWEIVYGLESDNLEFYKIQVPPPVWDKEKNTCLILSPNEAMRLLFSWRVRSSFRL